jgi:hypothetical protein
MPIDDRTQNRNYQLPNPANLLSEDVQRLRAALVAIDTDVFARYTKGEVDGLLQGVDAEVMALAAQIDAEIAGLVGGAPGDLATIGGLAAALGNDPVFSANVAAALSARYTKTESDARYIRGLTHTEDVFTGNNTTGPFPLTTTPSTPASVLVTVGGVVQPTSAYSITGSALSFNTAPLAGATIRVLTLGVTGPQSGELITYLAMVQQLDRLREDLIATNLGDYTGPGPLWPIVADEGNRILLGYDQTKREVVGVGIINRDSFREVADDKLLGPLLVGEYSGPGPVWPLLTDQNGGVLLGYDQAAGAMVAVGLGGGTSTALKPLALPPVAKTLNHLLSYGQSLSVGSAGGLPVLSITQPYSNVTFNGGPRASGGAYAPLGPLVESVDPDGIRTETICSGAANFALSLAAIENGVLPSDHVILASAPGQGGAGINGLKKGSLQYNNVLLAHITQAKALASDYALQAFAWIQGETDQQQGTSLASYRSQLEQLRVDIQTDAQAIGGQTSPVYCITYQTPSRVTMNGAAVQLAQLDLAQKNEFFTLATPCYHMPFHDGTHMTPAGYKWLGAYFGRAYKRLLFDGVKPPFLSPLSATRRDAVIRVRFNVPNAPLVLDTTTLAPTTDLGFRVTSNGTTVAISNIAVEGSAVVITLAAVPTGTVKVRYALDYLGQGLTIDTGASGNLRDSNPDTIRIDGITRPLYNLCPHFELTAVTLGE